jgi:hypothetical protein
MQTAATKIVCHCRQYQDLRQKYNYFSMKIITKNSMIEITFLHKYACIVIFLKGMKRLKLADILYYIQFLHLFTS